VHTKFVNHHTIEHTTSAYFCTQNPSFLYATTIGHKSEKFSISIQYFPICMISNTRVQRDCQFFFSFSVSGATSPHSHPFITLFTKLIVTYYLLRTFTMKAPKAPLCKNGCITASGNPSRHHENKCPFLRKEAIAKMRINLLTLNSQ
jgi:hypothetical protein